MTIQTYVRLVAFVIATLLMSAVLLPVSASAIEIREIKIIRKVNTERSIGTVHEIRPVPPTPKGVDEGTPTEAFITFESKLCSGERRSVGRGSFTITSMCGEAGSGTPAPDPEPEEEGSVMISEISYNPDGSDSGREWIEVHNGTNESVNLADWSLRENDTDHALTLVQGSATLAAGEYAVIADNAVTFMSEWPDVEVTVFDSAFSLTNTGEALALKDENGDIVDEVTYDPNDGGDGDGNTLHRVNDAWTGVTPTPGA